MGGLGVKVQHFPLTLLVVLTTLTLPCERDAMWRVSLLGEVSVNTASPVCRITYTVLVETLNPAQSNQSQRSILSVFYSVSQTPLSFSDIFPKRLRIFSSSFISLYML